MSRYISNNGRKSLKKGSFFFLNSTWNIGVQVIIAHDTKMVKKIAEKRFPSIEGYEGLVGHDEPTCGAGYYVTNKNNGSEVVLYLKYFPEKIYDYAIIAHEIFHIVYGCLSRKGMVVSEDSEEAYAYLTEAMFKDIMVGIAKMK